MLLIFISGFLGLNAYSQYLFTIDVSANHIEYDSKRELIYATIKGDDSHYANSLIAINPYDGTITKNIFIGSEPTDFVFTMDSNFIFIIFDEQPMVKKFDLESFTVIQETNLGISQYNGAYYGKSLAVLPDNDTSVIVSRKYKGVSPDFGGVAIYSNGKKLPYETSGHHGPEYLVNTGNDTIYAYASNFFSLQARPDSGIVIIQEIDDLGLTKAKYEKGLIFDDHGKIVDPKIMAQMGKISLNDDYGFQSYAHQADFSNNKVFFSAANNGNVNIDFYSYNRTTFGFIDKYSIPNVIPSGYSTPAVSQLIRFGKKGLATTVYDSYYFTEESPFIAILNNSSFVDSISPEDTSELAQLFVLDTVYTYEHVIVYDTLDVYNYISIYDTTHLSTTDTLIFYQKTTNVNGNIIKSEISLYPNPTNNYINIEITNNNVIENYTVRLYNTLGELFFDSQLTSNLLTIDISSYSKGTYILTLTNNFGQKVATKYVVVK